MSRILVPIINPAPFIEADISTLRTRHEVTVVRCVTPAEIGRCALATRTHDQLFCWFGSLRFLLPVIAARGFGKRITIIAGGYDVANEPAFGYGNMQGDGWRSIPRALGRLLFSAAHRVVTYSHAATHEAITNALVDQGRLRMIYLGIEEPAENHPTVKSGLVLSVSGIDASTIHRKGLLTIARASRLLPGVEFVIAGRHHDPQAVELLRSAGGSNLSLPGYVTDRELLDLYRRAKVYVQPSLHEAFGCSVAEAMMLRCIPVVSRRGSLPELAGETGFYVEPGDAEGTAAALRQALAGPAEGSGQARLRVQEMFDARRRRDALLDLMS